MELKIVIQFIKDFISMFIVFSLVEFVFYKLKLIDSFNIFYIIGFMTGWVIVQIAKLTFFNKKK